MTCATIGITVTDEASVLPEYGLQLLVTARGGDLAHPLLEDIRLARAIPKPNLQHRAQTPDGRYWQTTFVWRRASPEAAQAVEDAINVRLAMYRLKPIRLTHLAPDVEFNAPQRLAAVSAEADAETAAAVAQADRPLTPYAAWAPSEPPNPIVRQMLLDRIREEQDACLREEQPQRHRL